eukprot:GILK01004831.1.p1 GENE.GILK01004831.1~~GILK01004831.1.p1  ORF type:complete len:377 (-),score=67.28 GILK01004831.1:299-1429(-)
MNATLFAQLLAQLSTILKSELTFQSFAYRYLKNELDQLEAKLVSQMQYFNFPSSSGPLCRVLAETFPLLHTICSLASSIELSKSKDPPPHLTTSSFDAECDSIVQSLGSINAVWTSESFAIEEEDAYRCWQGLHQLILQHCRLLRHRHTAHTILHAMAEGNHAALADLPSRFLNEPTLESVVVDSVEDQPTCFPGTAVYLEACERVRTLLQSDRAACHKSILKSSSSSTLPSASAVALPDTHNKHVSFSAEEPLTVILSPCLSNTPISPNSDSATSSPESINSSGLVSTESTDLTSVHATISALPSADASVAIGRPSARLAKTRLSVDTIDEMGLRFIHNKVNRGNVISISADLQMRKPEVSRKKDVGMKRFAHMV